MVNELTDEQAECLSELQQAIRNMHAALSVPREQPSDDDRDHARQMELDGPSGTERQSR